MIVWRVKRVERKCRHDVCGVKWLVNSYGDGEYFLGTIADCGTNEAVARRIVAWYDAEAAEFAGQGQALLDAASAAKFAQGNAAKHRAKEAKR